MCLNESTCKPSPCLVGSCYATEENYLVGGTGNAKLKLKLSIKEYSDNRENEKKNNNNEIRLDIYGISVCMNVCIYLFKKWNTVLFPFVDICLQNKFYQL